MILFPNCKINLGLRVGDKRPDGYHHLETIFYPIALRDAAEITTFPTKKEPAEAFGLTVTGIPIPGPLTSNLCYKAWEMIKADFPDMPPVRMHLHKAIPAGAGLGGGSSDGAFTLMLLNDLLQLNIPTEKLLEYALHLGSDCPFFILNKPCYATGRGEIMEEIYPDLSDYHFVIVHPNIHVNTAEAFKDLAAYKKKKDAATQGFLYEWIKQPVDQWKEHIINEFEEPVFKKHPLLKEIKKMLYDAGAEYASMTGTGSSLFGIFHNNKKTGHLEPGENYKVYTIKQSH